MTKAVATVPNGVSDGNFHTVTVNYYNKTVTISIDNCDTALALKHGGELGGKWACAGFAFHELEPRCASIAETCYRFLDLTGPLQLGGLPSLPATFQPKNHHFIGCISDFKIDHRFVDLNALVLFIIFFVTKTLLDNLFLRHVTDNGTTPGCPEKRSFCKSRPCRNGGFCHEGWSTYKCDCPEGFGGKDCSEGTHLIAFSPIASLIFFSLVINTPWRFSGDGTLSFNPLLRPIQLPWLNALSVRTLQTDAFLMSVQVGQNSSSVLSVSIFHFHYIY